jgi:tetratricopeptide (TPR) repeat protein
MLAYLPSRGLRKSIVAAALAAALALSYFSIRNARAFGFASELSSEGFERSVRLEPGNARNWYLMGQYWQYNLEEPDVSRAIRAYLTSLSLNPAASDVWVELGSAYELAGNQSAARDAFLHAKKAYPLSANVSWRYGNFLLRQGELQSAFSEIRRAIEADPKRGAEAFSRAYRADSNVEEVLDRAIPPLSSVYVDAISDQLSEGNTSNAIRIWNRLATIHPQISLPDAFQLVNTLLSTQQVAEAHRTWEQAVQFAGLADLQQPPNSILWDGGFESGIIGGAFGWFFPPPSSEVQINIDAQEVHSGSRSLRLTFTGKSNLNLDGLCHFVAVQPSTTYSFSAWVKPRAVTSDQGVRFRLRSSGVKDASELLTADVRGDLPWTRVESFWTSGKDAQLAQVCILRLPSDQPDYRIQGTAWIDDAALVPVSSELRKP